MKIIEENEQFFVCEWEYDGMPITIRRWKHADITEIKADQYFAKANGYKSVSDMAEQTIGKGKFKELFGGVPKWIRVTDKGDFFFFGRNKALLN